MGDWPPIAMLGPRVTITPFHPESLGLFMGSSPASGVWTANLALYYPFRLAVPYIVTKLFAYNGAIVAGNIDVGIYDRAGRRIVSVGGATPQAGVNSIQEFDIADTLIGPGQFYLAVSENDGTATLFRSSGGARDRFRATGFLEQVGGFPLPATATFAALTAARVIACIGLTGRVLV